MREFVDRAGSAASCFQTRPGTRTWGKLGAKPAATIKSPLWLRTALTSLSCIRPPFARSRAARADFATSTPAPYTIGCFFLKTIRAAQVRRLCWRRRSHGAEGPADERTERGALAGVLPTYYSSADFGDGWYDPIYAAAERLDVGLGFHTGTSADSLGGQRFRKFLSAHTIDHPAEQMMAMIATIIGGVFERFPKLSIAYLESGIGWVPYMMDRLDEEVDKRGADEAPYLSKCRASTSPAGGFSSASNAARKPSPTEFAGVWSKRCSIRPTIRTGTAIGRTRSAKFATARISPTTQNER